MPAGGPPGQHDVVPGGDGGDALPDRRHRPRRLVAEQERELVVDGALPVVEVGVAHAAGEDVDEGAAPEIVRDGETGFVVADEDGMIAAIDKVSDLSAELCRADVVDRFSVERVARAYAEVYRSVVRGGA